MSQGRLSVLLVVVLATAVVAAPVDAEAPSLADDHGSLADDGDVTRVARFCRYLHTAHTEFYDVKRRTRPELMLFNRVGAVMPAVAKYLAGLKVADGSCDGAPALPRAMKVFHAELLAVVDGTGPVRVRSAESAAVVRLLLKELSDMGMFDHDVIDVVTAADARLTAMHAWLAGIQAAYGAVEGARRQCGDVAAHEQAVLAYSDALGAITSSKLVRWDELAAGVASLLRQCRADEEITME
jgi:hypothetical protein